MADTKHPIPWHADILNPTTTETTAMDTVDSATTARVSHHNEKVTSSTTTLTTTTTTELTSSGNGRDIVRTTVQELRSLGDLLRTAAKNQSILIESERSGAKYNDSNTTTTTTTTTIAPLRPKHQQRRRHHHPYEHTKREGTSTT